MFLCCAVLCCGSINHDDPCSYLYRVDFSIDSPRHRPHARREGCQVQHECGNDEPVVAAGAATGVGVQLLLSPPGTLLLCRDAYAGCHWVFCQPTEGASLQGELSSHAFTCTVATDTDTVTYTCTVGADTDTATPTATDTHMFIGTFAQKYTHAKAHQCTQKIMHMER